MALSPAAVATIAAQSAELGDWPMPAGAAIGAATALLIRFRRAKRTSDAPTEPSWSARRALLRAHRQRRDSR